MTLTVGQTVYLKPVGNRYNKHGDNSPQKYEVKSIGKKYFEVWTNKKEYTTEKFYLDNFNQVTKYSPTWSLYFSLQEIFDENEINDLYDKIKTTIGEYRANSKISLEQWRKIWEIIKDNL